MGKWIIRHEGCGGFLNPPGHPEHSFHIEEFHPNQHGRDVRAYMSLSSTEEWIPAAIRAQAERMLEEWEGSKLPLDSADVQDWIHQVLGYFHDCYKGDGENPWNADKLRISKDADPMLSKELHAGVRFIQQYYPEYEPKREDFDGAYWGTKPEKRAAEA